MTAGEWYYSLKDKTVVHADDAKAEDRLGPYATREEAQHALDRVHARNEAWDNDPRWNDPEEREQRRAGEDDDNPFTV